MRKRKYNISDASLLGHSGNSRKNLRNDLPDFTAFDGDLNEAKLQAWETAETRAFTVGTHEDYLAKSRILTDQVNAALRHCQDTFTMFRYFLKKYFKSEPAFIRQFNISRFNKIRQKQDEVILFFSTLARQVANNRATLEAKGLKPDLLDSIDPAGKALKEANDEQDAFLKTQQVETTERIAVFNALYDILVEFSDAAGIIYKDRPDKRSVYTLPQNGLASDDDEAIDSDDDEKKKDDKNDDHLTE